MYQGYKLTTRKKTREYRFGASGTHVIIDAISPNSGPAAGGTSFTLTGRNFILGATIKIGGVSATSVVFVNSTTLTGVTPAGSVGVRDAIVTNPDGSTGTQARAFTYTAQAQFLLAEDGSFLLTEDGQKIIIG